MDSARKNRIAAIRSKLEAIRQSCSHDPQQELELALALQLLLHPGMALACEWPQDDRQPA